MNETENWGGGLGMWMRELGYAGMETMLCWGEDLGMGLHYAGVEAWEWG